MEDKTVVITGATIGLGRATALQIAQKGIFVVIVARSNTKANEVIISEFYLSWGGVVLSENLSSVITYTQLKFWEICDNT